MAPRSARAGLGLGATGAFGPETWGYLALVLHAHLPFVRHPEHQRFMEEHWLFEAITESYLPLLRVYQGLLRDGIDFRLTMSLTPPLLAMLSDELLMTRYRQHLARLAELAQKEVERTRTDPQLSPLAHFYLELFTSARDLFQATGGNLTQGFRQVQDTGKLEIITSCATHSFLPLMQQTPKAVQAQIVLACEDYRRRFGRDPRGIWLPECGYYPGLDKYLAEQGLRFFIVDAHGILHADHQPRYGVYAPLYCPSGVAAFGRDLESSKQVWSAEEGYPGDGDYREFYRDIGFDLDLDYIRPYIHPDGIRMSTGIKYHRVTGKIDLSAKELYHRGQALAKAEIHAGHFLGNREKQVEHLYRVLGRKPIIVAPYDAELFGHWWFEGPQWIDYLLRRLYYGQRTVLPTTPLEYLARHPAHQVATPAWSSWGNRGYAEAWLNQGNAWIYQHLHLAAWRMTELAQDYPDAQGLRRRALNQAARELLLAQASDWAFILSTGTTVEYAVKRIKVHIDRFNRLHDMVRGESIDEPGLADVEGKDNIFPDIDYRVYA